MKGCLPPELVSRAGYCPPRMLILCKRRAVARPTCLVEKAGNSPPYLLNVVHTDVSIRPLAWTCPQRDVIIPRPGSGS